MGSKKRKNRQKAPKVLEPTKCQNRVLYASIAEIVCATFGILYQLLTLFGLQNADVQAALAASIAENGIALSLDQMMVMIRTLTAVQLIAAACALATGIYGIKVAQKADAASLFSRLCMFAIVLTGVGAVVSIQTGTVIASFVLLGVTVLLDIYAHKIKAELGLEPEPRKKRR